jgi:hypothetical protein
MVNAPFHPLVEFVSAPLDGDGRLPPALLEAAVRRMPFLQTSLTQLGSEIHPRDLRRAFTVDLIARLIVAAAS